METLKLYAGWAVLTAWLVSTLYSAVDRTWSPPSELGIAAIAVVTFLFGERLLNNRKKNHA